MDTRAIQDKFLAYLYNLNYNVADPDLADIETWAIGEHIDKDLFWKAYDGLCLSETIKYRRALKTVRLTPKGTLLAEKTGLVGKEVVAQCRDVRKRMLFAMAEHYQAFGAAMPLQKLLDCARVTQGEFWRTIPLLNELGYCDWDAARQQVIVCPAVAPKVRIQPSDSLEAQTAQESLGHV